MTDSPRVKLEFHHSDATPHGGVVVMVGGEQVRVNAIEIKMTSSGVEASIHLPVDEISGFISLEEGCTQLLKCCAACNAELREANGIGPSDGQSN